MYSNDYKNLTIKKTIMKIYNYYLTKWILIKVRKLLGHVTMKLRTILPKIKSIKIRKDKDKIDFWQKSRIG